MMTQQELELETYGFGRVRAEERIAKLEQQGKADEAGYASTVYRRFVLPVAEAIRLEKLDLPKRGPVSATKRMVLLLENEPTAFVVVRCAIQHLMGRKADNARVLFSELGQTAYHEHLLTCFEGLEPKLFNQLTQGFAQRMSKDERYRLNVVRAKAAEKGRELPEWDVEDIQRLGHFMAGLLVDVGMLELKTEQRGKERHTVSFMTDECAEAVQHVRHDMIEGAPYFMPCVEPPKPWVALDDGGFHTEEMRRLAPYAVKAKAIGREKLERADLAQTFDALNAMQATPWRVNGRVLAAMETMAGKIDMGEVLAQGEQPKPQRPTWLAEGMPVESMTDDQRREFRQWKKELSKWYTQTKQQVIRWGRYRQCINVATKLKDYPALWFVYFSDFRDRKYALTSGISPQGSDMQKALIEFAEGLPIDTDDAAAWFLIAGASRFGYDKEELHDRVAWAGRNLEEIMACAADPVANQWWMQADKPLQFLAWCFEFEQWQIFGDMHLSHLSVGMDGTCNGLQNFSAMLRDEVGGEATNLVPSLKPQDIYGRVAVRTTTLLECLPVDELDFRNRWLDHGMNRKITKRSVMTLPYGSTRFSCAEFIAGDYLAEGYVPEFDESEHLKAASYLARSVWSAIGDVVKKATEAMNWLQAAAGDIIAGGANSIGWITPTGFPVVQVYWEEDRVKINSRLAGQQKLRLHVKKETNKADKRRHKNGISPNFIHSLDAAHLTRVANALHREGVPAMHMVHDDFGVHPKHAATLYRVIREEFVDMYETHAPLEAFQERYPAHCGPLPEPGTLDLQLVHQSHHFFS
ncbi:RNA polymerase [Klebsiella phage RCIP0075]